MDTPPSASARKPSALFLSPEPPYPMIGGGPLRSASLLEYWSRRFSVQAIVFHQEGDPDPADAMPAGRVDRLDVIELPHYSKQPIARAVRNSSRLFRDRPPLVDRFPDLGYYRQNGFGTPLRCRDRGALLVCARRRAIASCSKRATLDLHNIESVWHRSLAASESPVHRQALRRFATASVALERQWLPKFDCLLVTSAPNAIHLASGSALKQPQLTLLPLAKRTTWPVGWRNLDRILGNEAAAGSV